MGNVSCRHVEVVREPSAAAQAAAQAMTLPWPTQAACYTLQHEVGRGAFGRVVSAWCPATSMHVAVKIVQLQEARGTLEAVQREVHVMQLSRHPNVLPLYTSFTVDATMWLVMPHMQGGAVAGLLVRGVGATPGRGLSEAAVAWILHEVLTGLAYLHGAGILHRDVKSANILLSADGSGVMLGDMGTARPVVPGGHGTAETVTGTVGWMAPEVIQGEAYGSAADVWSVGILALELLTGAPPHAHLSQLALAVHTARAPPPTMQSYAGVHVPSSSRRFDAFVAECLKRNPAARATAAGLLRHSFITGATESHALQAHLQHTAQAPLPPAGMLGGGGDMFAWVRSSDEVVVHDASTTADTDQ